MITIDAVNRDYLGFRCAPWDTTPIIDQVAREGTILENVLTTRGLTPVALGSLLTGAWPKHVGVRSAQFDSPYTGALALVQERFQSAGWDTLGFSGNECQYLEQGFDSQMCTEPSDGEGYTDQATGDAALVAELARAIREAPEDRPLFAWVHMVDPHNPFVPTEYIDAFHPEPYTGALDPADDDQVEAWILVGQDPSPAELEYLQAAYASQIRGADDRVGLLLQEIEARGWGSRAVIAIGTDHGEELFGHNHYPYHGCSPFQDVLATSWVLRSPGAVPADQRLGGWVSIVDIAPTLAELAGLEWDGLLDGRSLVSALATGVESEGPVFFERDPELAGVVLGDAKYFLTTEPRYDTCEPYQAGSNVFYETATEALYDLSSDPGELTSLPLAGESWESMRSTLCAWVMDGPWLTEGDNEHSDLVQACGP